MSCVFCNTNAADTVNVGPFTLSLNEAGDVTISIAVTNGVILPETSRFSRIRSKLTGTPEPIYPMREIISTAHGAFDRCPICGDQLNGRSRAELQPAILAPAETILMPLPTVEEWVREAEPPTVTACAAGGESR